MRIVMGVKEYESGQMMINAIGELAFPSPEIEVVHAIEAPGGALGKVILTASEGDFIAQYLNNQRYMGQTMLEALGKSLEKSGMKAKLRLVDAGPSEAIEEASRQSGADLISIFLQPKKSWDGFFGARVARRLLSEADRSLFICRPPRQGTDMRHAVFATDHSPYADRCLERLLSMRPAGIETLTVMTAYQRDLVASLGPFVGQLGLDVSRWVRDKLHEENGQALERIRAAGWDGRSEVRESTVYEAIAASMEAHKAGLLILGAQGHGFVERLTMGSVSLHETLYGRYPILVLRM